MWRNRLIDHRNDRSIVDLLNARRLVLSFEGEIDLLAHIHLPSQPTLLEHHCRRLLPPAVPLVKRLHGFFRASELTVGRGHTLLAEPATLSRLRLTLLGIEFVEVLDQAIPDGGFEGPVAFLE